MACCPGCMCLAHGNPSLQGPITGSFLIISSLASQSQHGGWNRGLTDSSTLTTAASMDALCFSFLVCTVGSVKPTLQGCFEEWGVYARYLNLAMGQQKWVSPKYEPQKATCALWTSRHRWNRRVSGEGMGLQGAAETSMCWPWAPMTVPGSICSWTREVVADNVGIHCPLLPCQQPLWSNGRWGKVAQGCEVPAYVWDLPSEGQVGSKLGESEFDFVVI